MTLTGFSHIFERLYYAPYLDELIPLPVFTGCFIFRRIIMRGLLFLLVKLLIKFPLKDNSFIPKIYWRSFLILAILLEFQNYPSFIFGFTTLSVFLKYTATLVTPLLLYYFFSSAIRYYNDNISYTIENKQRQLEQRHFTEISDLYENLRQVRHDLKNHIFIMDGLLNNENYNELKSYFSQLKGSLEVLSFVDTGSYCINAVLNNKIHLAQIKDITMAVTASIPKELQIIELDICSVLGNLLDNAIEASDIATTKHITVDISFIRNYLSITVTNTVDYDVIAQNPSLYTTKYGNEAHGLGLKIIRKIANKYDGMCLFTMKEHDFVGSAQLKNIAPTNLDTR